MLGLRVLVANAARCRLTMNTIQSQPQQVKGLGNIMSRFCSNKTSPTTPPVQTPVQPVKLTLYQRFQAAYKQYGKVMLGVHLVLSAGWFGSFYLLASRYSFVSSNAQ